ncbi:hypothetical protein F2P81_012230 [Scophthalmus maximus]|uniref:Uncharacterized protein n=1 Tax=Scophthalmus maximus TaxID=52904 RepID=A0A6A4SWM3_SCOMX|nr:hypothetical protein F2P81_012230 [Scophthalmus maximus]
MPPCMMFLPTPSPPFPSSLDAISPVQSYFASSAGITSLEADALDSTTALSNVRGARRHSRRQARLSANSSGTVMPRHLQSNRDCGVRCAKLLCKLSPTTWLQISVYG